MDVESTSLEIIVDGVSYNSVDDVPFEMQEACRKLLEKLENGDATGVIPSGEWPESLIEKLSRIKIKRVVSNSRVNFTKKSDFVDSYNKVDGLFRAHEEKTAKQKTDLNRKVIFLLSVLGMIYYIYSRF